MGAAAGVREVDGEKRGSRKAWGLGASSTVSEGGHCWAWATWSVPTSVSHSITGLGLERSVGPLATTWVPWTGPHEDHDNTVSLLFS